MMIGRSLERAKNLGGVKPAGLAEAHGAAEDGGPGHMEFASFEDDGFVKWGVAVSIAFADEDSEQDRVVGELHVSALSRS